MVAIHRVDASSVEIWVGTLFPTLIMPKRARVKLFDEDCLIRSKVIKKGEWKRPLSKTQQRFWTLVTFRNLKPSTSYTVSFDRFVEPEEFSEPFGWRALRNACFDTLPQRIPTTNAKPFTIGLGSCF